MADITLADVCEAIVDCEHKTAPLSAAGYPSIRTTNIKNGRLDLANSNRVDHATYEAWTQRRRPVPGDLILAREAPVGEVGIIPFGAQVVLGQRTVLICPDRSKADPHYLLFIMIGPEMRHRMTSKAGGSTVDHLNMRDIRALPLPELPPLPEQRALAAVLGALDDKIEVNRKMARVLEEIARAVFTSWFVDFDPVRRRPLSGPTLALALPESLAALFPTRLVDSPLGEVPEGWRVGTIDSLCVSITSGGTPARMNKEYWEGGTIPWFKTGELFDGPLFESEEHITKSALENSSCKLWPAGTILFALYASPTVGRLGVLTRSGTSNQAAAGLTVKAEFGVPFLMNALFFARAKLQQIAVGAAQQNINQGVLKAHQIVVPPSALASRFSTVMQPAFEKQAQLAEQSATLAALRDTLLPKLISGELRIADVERIVGRATHGQ